VKRILFIQIIFLSFLFYSCDDFFHNTDSILENIDGDYDEDLIDPDPLRIIIGGDFKYSFNGVDHEALAVLDGEGNMIENAFDQSVYGLYGDGTGYSGIRDMELTSDYLYVSGQFRGYKNTAVTDNMKDDYAYLMRYTYSDGVYSYDSNYKPAMAIPDYSGHIEAINLLNDGSLAVGGSFSNGLNPYFSIIKPDGTEYSPLPSIINGSSVNTMSYFPNDSIMFIAGNFKEIGLETGYMEYASINIDSVTDSATANPPGAFLEDSVEDPLLITDFYDVEFTENQELFIAGYDMNASGIPYWMPGVFRKYIYNGEKFTADTAFNTQFRDVELIRDPDATNLPHFDSVRAIATDSDGRVYIGGDFQRIKDLNGREHRGIIRLMASGMIDPTFTTDINGQVYLIEFQKNGKILVCGDFTDVNGRGTNGYVRLMPDGGIDESFHMYGIPLTDNGPTMNMTYIYSVVIEEEPEPVN